jgi:hypothetical protein
VEIIKKGDCAKMKRSNIGIASFVFVCFLMCLICGCAGPGPKPVTEITKPDSSKMSDDEFLDMIEKKCFLFLWNEANPQTGLIKDRADNFNFEDDRRIASVASVGYGLSAICIAQEKGWVGKKAAYERVLNTLKFFRDEMESNHGFYYHFVHMDTGQHLPSSEGSSIDTAIFLAGALTAGQYYKGTEVEVIANELYERADWQWMLGGGQTLTMGWGRNDQMLMARWNHYNEGILCYLLAIGSPTYPIPASSWDEINRPVRSYEEYTCIACSPLFTHQFPQHWIDLRNIHDDYADYYLNSKIATLANRQFCINNSRNFKSYGPDSWGLTACDGPGGYKVYGALPATAPAVHDGTVAPTAAAGSMMFTPEESLAALRFMYDNYNDKIWGRYGFSDAYNITRNWYAKDVIGIDVGAMILGIENARTGFIWDLFMQNECINTSLDKIGFEGGTKEISLPPVPNILAVRAPEDMIIDGKLSEWSYVEFIELEPRQHLEYGNLTDRETDLLSDCMFMWDAEYLYVAFKVCDNQILTPYKDRNIYRNDAIELFIDPENNKLIWGNPLDFQIGLTISGKDKKPQAWAWFQREEIGDNIILGAAETKNGYIIEAAIKWSFLKVKPKDGLIIGICPAVHDLDDNDNSATAKLTWYFINQQGGSQLGTLELIETIK